MEHLRAPSGMCIFAYVLCERSQSMLDGKYKASGTYFTFIYPLSRMSVA